MFELQIFNRITFAYLKKVINLGNVHVYLFVKYIIPFTLSVSQKRSIRMHYDHLQALVEYEYQSLVLNPVCSLQAHPS